MNRPFENNRKSWDTNIRVDLNDYSLKMNVNGIGSEACLITEFDISYRRKLQEC